jgi:adrenodoxin-NADP+ reductase
VESSTRFYAVLVAASTMLSICDTFKRVGGVQLAQRPSIKRALNRTSRKTKRNLHVAIVGSGPAGFYTADELFRSKLTDVKVDMYERLPTPYGLVRNGVAPDHPEVKAVESVFHSLALSPSFNFIGNVTVGQDISINELKEHYEVVILAYGAEDDKKLGIPGEDLKGVHSARAFVEWYNAFALQNTASDAFDLSATDVAIIGNGNVAVDVARILLRSPSELANTDISDRALAALEASSVKRVSLVGRRGPVQAAFTTGELRELLGLAGVSKWIPDRMFASSEADEEELKERPKKRKFDLLKKQLLAPPPSSDERALQFYFLRSPVAFIEDEKRPGHVGSIKFEHNFLEGEANNQQARGSAFFSEMPAQLVFTSIGYSSKPMPSLPFDKRRGIIPNTDGKVESEKNVYVCGWIKRGPSGIIGTNKFDAEQVTQTIVDDLSRRTVEEQGISISGKPCLSSPSTAIKDILAKRSIQALSFENWLMINDEELARGREKSKLREKVKSVQEMVRIATQASNSAL